MGYHLFAGFCHPHQPGQPQYYWLQGIYIAKPKKDNLKITFPADWMNTENVSADEPIFCFGYQKDVGVN
jgi:hypothetical protein